MLQYSSVCFVFQPCGSWTGSAAGACTVSLSDSIGRQRPGQYFQFLCTVPKKISGFWESFQLIWAYYYYAFLGFYRRDGFISGFEPE